MVERELTTAHFERMLAVVGEVSASEDVESLRDNLNGALEQLIGGDLQYVLDVDASSGAMDLVMTPAERAVPTEVAIAVFEYEHPIVSRFLESGDGSAIRLSDLVSSDEYHELPIYRDHYAAHGVEYQLGATVPCPEHRLFSVGLNRSSADFDEIDVAILDRLRPHLIQAARNVEVRSRLDEMVAGRVDDVVHGAAVVERGQLREADGRVVEAMRDAFGRGGTVGSLPSIVDDWTRSAQRRLDEARTSGELPLHRPLTARGNDTRVILRYVEGAGGSGTVVVDQRCADDGRRLRGYGLTAREAEVLASLAMGNSNAQIAAELGISSHTVRKHLERVYRKLSVDSRTAAVALAHEVFGRVPPA